MNSIQFLLDSVLGFYCYVLFYRAWFQYCNVEYYHPTSQWLVKITQPVLGPLRKIIPTIKNIDLAAFVLIFVLASLIAMSKVGGDLLASVIIGSLSTLKVIGKGIMYVLFVGAIASWFQNGTNQQFQYILYKLGEPVLSPIRRFLPRTGMIDFSPMVVMFVLFFLNNLLYDLLQGLWGIA